MGRTEEPLAERPDAVVYTSVDRRVLATILIHMQAQGTFPKTMSEMIRAITETFCEWTVRCGAQPIESLEEAARILRENFKASLNPGNRYSKNLLQKLEEQDERGIDSLPMPRGRKPQWSDADALRMQAAAEKALNDPRIQKLLNNNGEEH
jgi:hypothetical protein